MLATRALVLVRYEADDVYGWFDRLLRECDSDDWSSCVEQLRRFLDWEYDGYPNT